MANSRARPNIFHRLNQSIASSKPGAWFFSHALHRMDKPVFQLSNGKYTAASILAGLPIVMLTTTGAKSGLARTVPLIAIPDGDNLILIASNWGQSHYPSWYYNLRANPEATIALQGDSPHDYVAREATDEEWERLWQKANDLYAGYAAYKERIAAGSNRSIPMMVMTPITGEADTTKTQD